MAADRAAAGRRRPWRAWPASVRARTTAAAVAVLAVALLLGGIALVAALRATLTREVRTAAQLRAAQVADLLESGAAPGPLADTREEDLVIQILDGGGQVVAASPNMAGRPPVTRLRAGESVEVPVPFDDDRYLAVAAAANTASGPATVVVARSLDRVGDSIRAVTVLLAVGLPLVLLVVAGTTWRLVGRALAPVETVRREVDEISATELHRRVPQPAGADEIARLAATMNRMLDRLQQAQDRQRRFISDAAHELRSPVASIRQHAEVARAHPGRTSTGELAETVQAEILRLQRLVDDLLLLAGADEQTLQLRRRPVDLDDLVFDEARRLRNMTRLRVDTSAVSAGRIDADQAAMRRVLRNLADNAARHATGTVAFALSVRDGTVVLDLDDDGPGIPDNDRERVFDRFVRLDDARARDDGGAGLGLAIVAELVSAHGGHVSLVESPLGGVRCTLRLPAVPEPDERD